MIHEHKNVNQEDENLSKINKSNELKIIIVILIIIFVRFDIF